MTNTVEALDHEVLFQPHPLDGESRFSLLGLLAGLYGLVSTFAFEPLTVLGVDPASQEFRDKHFPPGAYPPGVLEESERLLGTDDRELANTILGERTVNAMFGKTGPVRISATSAGSPLERTSEGTK